MKKSVENMFLHRSETKEENLTLDAHRYTQFQHSLKRNATKLESLLLTSPSAVSHLGFTMKSKNGLEIN